jgi:hypothetical protein
MSSTEKKIKLDSVHGSPMNPRSRNENGFKRLMQSIKDHPEMMVTRPICVDVDTNEIIAGNRRHEALILLGYTEVPENWIYFLKGWSKEEKEHLMIADNINEAGTWDLRKIIADGWDLTKLKGMGLTVDLKKLEIPTKGEVEFSQELEKNLNYVVLVFKTDIDWLNIKTTLGLDTKYSKRTTGEPWNSGVGRVVDGVAAIEKIKNSGK